MDEMLIDFVWTDPPHLMVAVDGKVYRREVTNKDLGLIIYLAGAMSRFIAREALNPPPPLSRTLDTAPDSQDR